MNIHDVATKSGVSIRALRKLEKLKLIAFDPDDDSDEHPRAAEIRFLLMRNQQLSAALLVELIDKPAALYDLRKYEARAREQIAALGDVAGTVAPIEALAVISDAAGADASAAQTLADWLTGILPSEPVSHYWVATRLLLPLVPGQRETLGKKISLALMNVRRLESFHPYWQSVPGAYGRSVINYFQKRENSLASFDL
ncbi:MAG: hypothetical protein H0X34_07075 [Chthoniobacterales bacterium]|nr:hypothetical protein [Chthoniobacterales bacterium]